MHRSVTTRDLKKERPVFRCSVSTFLQLVVACYRRSDSGVRREVKEREKIRREMERKEWEERRERSFALNPYPTPLCIFLPTSLRAVPTI